MTLAAYKVTGRKRRSQLVKWEANPDYCRESFTLLAGSGGVRKVVLGTLLAMTFGAAAINVSQVADAGNTGDGTLALADPAFTSAVLHGDYTVVCTTGGADGASKFRVEDPSGAHIGTATGGAAFAKHIKFTISGGAADFVEGDRFIISVTKEIGDPTNKVVSWVPDAVDGTERIWGVSLDTLEAADGVDAAGGLALRRGGAILFAGEISWPDGITEVQKEGALVVLEGMGLLVR